MMCYMDCQYLTILLKTVCLYIHLIHQYCRLLIKLLLADPATVKPTFDFPADQGYTTHTESYKHNHNKPKLLKADQHIVINTYTNTYGCSVFFVYYVHRKNMQLSLNYMYCTL